MAKLIVQVAAVLVAAALAADAVVVVVGRKRCENYYVAIYIMTHMTGECDNTIFTIIILYSCICGGFAR